MTIETILNARGLRRCIASPRSTGEWWACCPACDQTIGDDKRRLLIRSYANASVSAHCLKNCPEREILAALDLPMDARRGDDGRAPLTDPGWWREPRRYDARSPVRPMGEQ